MSRPKRLDQLGLFLGQPEAEDALFAGCSNLFIGFIIGFVLAFVVATFVWLVVLHR